MVFLRNISILFYFCRPLLSNFKNVRRNSMCYPARFGSLKYFLLPSPHGFQDYLLVFGSLSGRCVITRSHIFMISFYELISTFILIICFTDVNSVSSYALYDVSYSDTLYASNSISFFRKEQSFDWSWSFVYSPCHIH